MSEGKTTTTLINAELPDSVDNALKNLTDKPTLNIGTTIADIWYLVFGGISNAAEKRKIKYAHGLEQYRKELDQKIKAIPEEKRKEPSFQVTAQALENSKYCLEEKELRALFASLISNSMNVDYSNDVHPSFAEIIKQMSVLDAKIIKKFKATASGQYPLCDYRLVKSTTGYVVLLENIFLELPAEPPLACSQSLSSLSRLGLIEIAADLHISKPETAYECFEQHPYFEFLKNKYPDNKIVIAKKLARLTSLGRSFVKVCIPD